MLSVLTADGKFLRHMKYIIFRAFPVDITQIKIQRPTRADRFGITAPQYQRVIYFFTGSDKSVRQRHIQIIHSAFDILIRKRVFISGIAVTIQAAKLSAENIFQDYMIISAALFDTVRRGDIAITHRFQ